MLYSSERNGRKRSIRNNSKGNCLLGYSIIGEPATDIGAFYTRFNDVEELENYILEEYKWAYNGKVKFLYAVHKATGKDIEDLISANRNNDMDYFCSLIPKKYLESMSQFQSEMPEGRMIEGIGKQSALLLHDVIQQFEEYMLAHKEIYSGLIGNEEVTFKNMESLLEGYEKTLQDEKKMSLRIQETDAFKLCSAVRAMWILRSI